MVYRYVRQMSRYYLAVNIEATDQQSKIRIKGQTIELSVCGCGLVSFRRFSKGTNVAIRLSHQHMVVKAVGRVAYANEDLGMGFAFTAIEQADKTILECWIEDYIASSI